MTDAAPAIRLYEKGKPEALAVGRLVTVKDDEPAAAIASAWIGVFAPFPDGSFDSIPLAVHVVDSNVWLKPRTIKLSGNKGQKHAVGLVFFEAIDSANTLDPPVVALPDTDNEAQLVALVAEARKRRVVIHPPKVRSRLNSTAAASTTGPGVDTSSGEIPQVGSTAPVETLVAGTADAISVGILLPERMTEALGTEKDPASPATPPNGALSKGDDVRYNESLAYSNGGIWCWFIRWAS